MKEPNLPSYLHITERKEMDSCLSLFLSLSLYIYIYKLATVVEGDQMATFSIVLSKEVSSTIFKVFSMT